MAACWTSVAQEELGIFERDLPVKSPLSYQKCATPKRPNLQAHSYWIDVGVLLFGNVLEFLAYVIELILLKRQFFFHLHALLKKHRFFEPIGGRSYCRDERIFFCQRDH